MEGVCATIAPDKVKILDLILGTKISGDKYLPNK